jgi:hypothetical protein
LRLCILAGFSGLFAVVSVVSGISILFVELNPAMLIRSELAFSSRAETSFFINSFISPNSDSRSASAASNAV